jgi:hypothetical protein
VRRTPRPLRRRPRSSDDIRTVPRHEAALQIWRRRRRPIHLGGGLSGRLVLRMISTARSTRSIPLACAEGAISAHLAGFGSGMGLGTSGATHLHVNPLASLSHDCRGVASLPAATLSRPTLAIWRRLGLLLRLPPHKRGNEATNKRGAATECISGR